MAVELASLEAQRHRHNYIGTEHLLLGLISVGSGVAADVINGLGIEFKKIRLKIERLIQSGPVVITMGKLPHTPRARFVIEYALDESRNLNQDYVGTEHILLGLLREEEGVAAQVLMNLGLKIDVVRTRIAAILSQDKEEFAVGRTLASNLDWPERAENKIEASLIPCPKCGGDRVVRALWRGMDNVGPSKVDNHAERAILTSISSVSPGKTPGSFWVCVKCAPGWDEVGRLVAEHRQLQLAKDEAIRNADFETAASHRDAQQTLLQRWSAVLKELLKGR